MDDVGDLFRRDFQRPFPFKDQAFKRVDRRVFGSQYFFVNRVAGMLKLLSTVCHRPEKCTDGPDSSDIQNSQCQDFAIQQQSDGSGDYQYFFHMVSPFLFDFDMFIRRKENG